MSREHDPHAAKPAFLWPGRSATVFGLVGLGLVVVGAAVFEPAVVGAAQAQTLTVNPGRFGAMTCQQLWYTEQEVLAGGRVCLRTDRARRAFRRADPCISDDEAILPPKTQDYLLTLRKTAREKSCPGF